MCWARMFGVVRRNLLVFLLFLAATVLMVVKWFVDRDVGGVLGNIAAGLITGGLVGYFVQRETARVAAEAARAQELVEARKRHKEEIDALLDMLLNTPAVKKEVRRDLLNVVLDRARLIDLEVELEFGSGICEALRAIENTEQDTAGQNTLLSELWNDLENHYPELKESVKDFCKRVEQYNEQVDQFIRTAEQRIDQWTQHIEGEINARVSTATIKTILVSVIGKDDIDIKDYFNNIQCKDNDLVYTVPTELGELKIHWLLARLHNPCTEEDRQEFIDKITSLAEELAREVERLEESKRELEKEEEKLRGEIVRTKLNKILPGNCNLIQTKQ